ncbi:TonB family protein [Roseateles amylovorans]|jgi:periplasmic protein TonB|uniref:TonB family protein n=1 Tax=Roseateles amylovorans TaxID=2978473 RepID=A0ABY6B1K9_9BURK|nr:TonB family protein [Roseateles amylovorans]UXH79287.1 TonB family protein [Roseateles amylovorans]
MSKPLIKQLSRGLLGLTAAVLLSAGAYATPKIIKKVPPEFPPEAARQSISAGSVRAKMNIDPDGKVSGVEILEAEPRKVFDKAVTRALMDWKFEASGEKQTHEVKLVFKNED